MSPAGTLRFRHPDAGTGEEPAGLGLSARGGLALVGGDEAVRQSILMLLSTIPGERVMRPTYGCHLHRLVFWPNDDTTAGLAMHYVQQAIERFEPRVEVLRVDATRDPTRPERLNLVLAYKVRTSATVDDLVVTFDLQGELVMPLPVPHLDDRDFARLLEDARALIPSRSPEWSDFTPGDPGMVLLELFAFLTDTMLYRLNRLPEKAYVAFLNLIGVQLEPPMAASVTLRFDAAESLTDPVTIPRGTRVTVGAGRSGGEDPVFATTVEVVVAPGGTAEVTAVHGDAVEAELIGTGTGGPGQRVQVASPPIIHRTIDGLELIVGVEATASELGEREPAVTYEGRAFRIWQEVTGFAAAGPDPHVYVVDRTAGTIAFSPAVRGTTERGLDLAAAPVAAVPGSGREIRAWYRHGGGVAGNVAAGTLTTLRVRIPGVTVTNPAPATGGRDTESLANALVRGPQQLHAVERAVTARDFELAALASSGAVARAKAFTRAELWTHAVPGTVEVLLVPAPPPGADVGVSARDMEARQTTDALATVRADLDARAPMGTRREIGWTRYKTVRVIARVVVHRAEDVDAVRRRMIERLQRTINPVPTGELRGWRYGEALRAFHIYDALLAERGVRYVDGVRLIVDDTPADVRALEADPSQPNTWYCASGPILFRSLDNAGGWEPSGRFEGETVEIVRTSGYRPGLVLVASRVGTSERSRLRVSTDCGETWEAAAELDFHVEDMTIVRRDDGLLAFLATDRGLYELPLLRAAVPVQILVDPARPDLGFYAVAAITSDQGDLNIAVAAQELGGIAISGLGGRPGTFRQLGSLQGKDIRVLFVREEGPRRFLIAGVTVSGAAPGEGAHMVEVVGVQISPQGWQPLTSGWQAGSCQSLAMQGRTILAASHAGGVMRLDLSVAQPAWEPSSVDCGLAMRDPGRFAPLTTVVAGPDARIVMVGGPLIDGVAAGVRRSDDGGETYRSVCEHEFAERVTLPATWLFCSGEHDVEVVVGGAPG